MQKRISTRVIASLKPSSKPYEVYDNKTTGFMLRIQPSGVKVYYAVYYLNGIRKRIPITNTEIHTPEQARDMAIEILGMAKKGIDPTRAKSDGVTLQDWVKGEYKKHVLQKTKEKEGHIDRILSAFPDLLDVPLDSITEEMVIKWVGQRQSLKKSTGERAVKDATIHRDIAYLRSALTYAARRRAISRNPLLGCRFIESPGNQVRPRFLSDTEEEKLFTALNDREEALRVARDSHNEWLKDRGLHKNQDLRSVAFADHLKPMVIVSLNTGMRRGELFSLTWESVSFDSAMLTIRGEDSKSSRDRVIPLNQKCLDCLKRWQEQTSATGLVFPSESGGQFDNCNTSWRNVLKAAGITNFRWHDMRHDFASKLVMAGVPLNTVRDLLGHSDIKMTLRYADIDNKVRADAVAKLDQPRNVVNLNAKREARKHA